MQSLGAKLRLERERLGLSIDKIAEDTRISHRYLEAIESDDHSSLPGEFFYRAFVRQYSKYLGWNPDETEKQISMVSSIPLAETSEPSPLAGNSLSLVRDQQINALRETLKDAPLRSAQDTGMPRSWLVFAAVVILGCIVYFGWRNFTPAEVAKSTPAPPQAQVQQAPVQQAPPPAAAPVENPKPAETTPVQPPPVTAAATNTNAPPPAGKFSLTIRAKETTWIRLTADGTKVHGGTLDAGQERTVNATYAEVLSGNAGTLEVIYNGKPISYGTKGEVKTILVTPEGWKLKPKPAVEPSATNTGSTSGNAAAGSLPPRAL